MVVRGFDQFECIQVAQLPVSEQRRSLRAIGFRDGDIVRTSQGDDVRMVELKTKSDREGSSDD